MGKIGNLCPVKLNVCQKPQGKWMSDRDKKKTNIN